MLVYSWLQINEYFKNIPSWKVAQGYLSELEKHEGIAIKRLWQILDQAWDELKISQNEKDLSKFLDTYYQHPVWLINAAFSESDPSTIADRLAAIRLISHIQPEKILDYGGGIGTVARLCSIW